MTRTCLFRSRGLLGKGPTHPHAEQRHWIDPRPCITTAFLSHHRFVHTRMLISLPPTCSYILLYFAITVSCIPDTATTIYSWNTSLSKLISSYSSASQKTSLFFSRLAFQSISGEIGIWEIMQIAGICATIPALLYIRKKSRQEIDSSESAQWRSSSSKLPDETGSPAERKKDATGKQVVCRTKLSK